MCQVTANKDNTRNLFYHFKTKHASEAVLGSNTCSVYQHDQTLQQISIAQAFSKSIPYDRKS